MVTVIKQYWSQNYYYCSLICLYDQRGCTELLTLLQINIREFYVHKVTMFLRSVTSWHHSYLRIWFSWVHNFHFWRLQENSYTNNASKASDFHTRWPHKNSNTKISHNAFKSQLWTVFLKWWLKDCKQRFWTPLPPLTIYHKPSATNYTHYHIMMARIVLHSVIHGSTSSLAPQHKFNVLEASNTPSHFSLLLSPHTHRTHITPQLTALFSNWSLFLNKRQSVLVAGLRDAPHSLCFFFKISPK